MTQTRHPPIAQAILLLVIAAVAAATAVTYAITFGGPPPRPAPIAVAAIAHELAGRAVHDTSGRQMVAAAELTKFRASEAPNPAIDAGIAAELGVSAAQIEGRYDAEAMPGRNEVRGGFTVHWHAANGARSVQTASQPIITRWHIVTFGGMLVALIALLIPAWWIARRISRPLRRLAAAADDARLGRPVAIPRDGPREVANMADAFAAMQTRLAGEIEGRAAMLAAIAHDLGTPLSRIAFHVEQLPDTARDRAAADIEEMRAMLGQVLLIARDERVGERVRVDLGSVIEALVDDLAAAGRPASATPGPRVLVNGDPAALRRLFANLIENAIRYGERARVAWTMADGGATVTIADDGPGFDPALAERMFEPFVRGDPSRNRATGGSGLGLAIVRTLAEAHGGTVRLGSDAGGGVVTVTLPID